MLAHIRLDPARKAFEYRILRSPTCTALPECLSVPLCPSRACRSYMTQPAVLSVIKSKMRRKFGWQWVLGATCAGAASIGLGAAMLNWLSQSRRQFREPNSRQSSFCSDADRTNLLSPALASGQKGHRAELTANLEQALSSVASANEEENHSGQTGEEHGSALRNEKSISWHPGQPIPSAPSTADAAGTQRTLQAGAGMQDIPMSMPAAELDPTGSTETEPLACSSSSKLSTASDTAAVAAANSSSSTPAGSSSSTSGAQSAPMGLLTTKEGAQQQLPAASEPPSSAGASASSPAWQSNQLRSTGLLPPLLGRQRQSEESNIPSSPAAKLSSPIKRPNINTAKAVPSLDVVANNAKVVPSLQVQYPDLSSSGSSSSRAMSLSARCALLCERNCISLRDISGELGETTALDIGCSTGGSSFELALSFSHVLGLDSDPMLVLAAKEMKESGVLEYHLNPSEPACYARVNPDVDRDRVRFWQYALPELPPKLHVVDAVLVEAVEVRKQPWLRRILEQVPGLLKPKGTCVVVLPGDGEGIRKDEGSSQAMASSSCSSGVIAEEVGGQEDGSSRKAKEDESGSGVQARVTAAEVRDVLGELGMSFVAEEKFEYSVQDGEAAGFAHAMVWHHA